MPQAGRKGRSGVPETRARTVRSEEPGPVGGVADEQVLGLLVVVEHHLVVLPADAGLLVTAEGRVGRVGVVAVGPYPASLDRTSEVVRGVQVAGPDAGAQAVQRVIRDLEGIGQILEP